MTDESELQQLKRRLSPLVLAVPGVTGVGIQAGRLTVYLADGSEQTRRNVASILEREAPGTEVAYVVTGRFRAQ